MIEKKISMKFG